MPVRTRKGVLNRERIPWDHARDTLREREPDPPLRGGATLTHPHTRVNTRDNVHMLTRSKLVLSCLAATLLLGAAVSTASATRLSLSGTSFRITWDRTLPNATDLTFAPTIGAPVTCPVTLEGTFHSATITKTANLLIGHVTRANVGTSTGTTAVCERGNATILTATLPWHVQYSSFGGILPSMTEITLRFINASFQIRNELATCLARTSTTEPGVDIADVTNPTTTRELLFLRANDTRPITLREGSFGCGAATAIFRGTGAVTLLNSSARPLLRLI